MLQKTDLATSLMAYKEQLLILARHRLKPILLRRVTPEEVVQDTLSTAYQKSDFLENCPDVPLFFKLRTLLFQTIAALERRHLLSQKRDAYKECRSDSQSVWERVRDVAPGPLTCMCKHDRYEVLKAALASLPDADRQIIELRHFDNFSNSACAEALHIAPTAAGMRYVRALERLRQRLMGLTEFHA